MSAGLDTVLKPALVSALSQHEPTQEADIDFLLHGLGIESTPGRRFIIASFRRQIWHCGAFEGWEAALRHAEKETRDG